MRGALGSRAAVRRGRGRARPHGRGAPGAARWLAVAALIGAACSAPSAPVVPARAARPAWQVRAAGGAAPIDPGVPVRSAASAGGALDLLDAAGCATCHAAISAEWSTSRHALAWTNDIFQREYAGRPLAWCVNCHAPLVTQQAGRFRDRGVDCAGCHLRGGALVSAARKPGSPHATVVDASFGSPEFCADCHDFNFPVLDGAGQVVRMTRHPMQSTVASFRAGPYAAQPGGCLACHGSRANHAFPGGHDAGMLGAALEVTWCARGAAIEVAVRNAAAGHAVPTGDIHRHFNLRVWRSSAPEALSEAFYGRRFEPDDAGGKALVWDSTIAPEATRRHQVELAGLGGEPDEPINLELIYVFLEKENVRADLAPREPFTTSVVRRRALPGELPRCAP